MAKAKIFGGRWNRLEGPPIGKGGQAEVFKVTDVKGDSVTEFAMKRVLNAKRVARFEKEIAAIGQLDHPNIVPLIDHSPTSGTDDKCDDDGKLYLVMPLAKGGDLSRPERVAMYRGNLDSTLVVAKQLALALKYAHDNGVINRDVKPANILFLGIGHDVWLADFGICILRDDEVITAPDEVMGPRHFIAPELEAGGRLDAEPAADIYALGKVIYFMISGGVVLPRERQGEPRFKEVFENGQRYQLLRLLLDKMICPIAVRLKAMDAVIAELDRIDAWERNASRLPVNPSILAAAARLRGNAVEVVRAEAQNEQARNETEHRWGVVRDSVLAWARRELEAVAGHLGDPDHLRLTVQESVVLPSPRGLLVQVSDHTVYRSDSGVGLSLYCSADGFLSNHQLQLHVGRLGPVVEITDAMANRVTGARRPAPAQDLQLALIPIYRRSIDAEGPQGVKELGYLSRPELVGTHLGQLPRGPGRQLSGTPKITYTRVEVVMRTFSDKASLIAPFKLSEWPAGEPALSAMLTSTLESFLNVVEHGKRR